MERFGNGRVALLGDKVLAERLEWPRRKRSAAEPEIELRGVSGDPLREPWIAKARPRPGQGPAPLWQRPPAGQGWTYLNEVPGLPRHIQRLDAPPRTRDLVVGISGLGRVGGLAAGALATVAARQSRIGTLLLHDVDAANLERWRLELGSVAIWGKADPLPRIEVGTLDDLFRRSDAFLFAASDCVPPLDATGDMRLPQFPGNRAILRETLAAARRNDYAGLFFMVSDPVECLAQAAFHDSNVDEAGRFTGLGLAPERIAGLALGVMWGRALCAARARGEEARVAAAGLPLGPHSAEVLAYDDATGPDVFLARAMTEAARHGNIRVRELGFLPYVGPALSSIVLTLPRLLAGKEVLASPFVDGLYFGGPCRLRWGMEPCPKPMAPAVRAQATDLHRLLQGRMERLGVAF